MHRLFPITTSTATTPRRRRRRERGGCRAREIILGGQRIAYTLRRSARKTLGLRIDHRGLTVGVPLRVGLREAEAFIRSHAGWVVDKLQARPRQPAAAFEPVDGASIPFSARPGSCGWARQQPGAVARAGPRQGARAGPAGGADARQLLLRGLQQRSLELFTHRVEEFCLRLGRPMPAVGCPTPAPAGAAAAAAAASGCTGGWCICRWG
jgi:predicted metal-dependent hydrolase